jgi:hypothetical protein
MAKNALFELLPNSTIGVGDFKKELEGLKGLQKPSL